MLKMFCAAILVPLTVACSSLTVSDQVFVNCTGYAKALSSLAVHKKAGNLDEGTIKVVDDIRSVVNPVCTGEVDPDNVAAKEVLEIQRNIQKLIELSNKEAI